MARKLLFAAAMKKIPLMVSVLAISMFSGCTDAPVETDETEEPAEEVPGEEKPDPACTAATDTLPLDQLVTSLRWGSTLTYDITRASDGTVYFVSAIEGDTTSIGRRVPCGAIEPEWMSISASITDLEISSDDQLYMGGTIGVSPARTARLYRLDLDDASAFPERLLSESGRFVLDLTAGPQGRVYFLSLGPTNTLNFVDGSEVHPVTMTLPFIPVTLGVNPDGTVLLAGVGSGQKLAHVVVTSVDTGIVGLYSLPRTVGKMRTDTAGGFYGSFEQGFGADTKSVLIHVPFIGQDANVLHEITQLQGGSRVAYDLADGGEALMLTPMMTETVTAVTLPAPLTRF